MIKDCSENICAIETCRIRTTPEGLFCRKHWDIVPGVLKASYQSARILCLKAVKAYEEVP